MRLNLIKCLMVGALIASPLGCEPQPVVVDPNDDTTVIEERDTVIERDTDPDGEVDVNVGGERGGIDVDVDRDAPEPNPTP